MKHKLRLSRLINENPSSTVSDTEQIESIEQFDQDVFDHFGSSPYVIEEEGAWLCYYKAPGHDMKNLVLCESDDCDEIMEAANDALRVMMEEGTTELCQMAMNDRFGSKYVFEDEHCECEKCLSAQ